MTKTLLQKQNLRRAIREKLRAQTSAQIAQASQKVSARLSAIEIGNKNVALFLAQPREPNIDEFARDLLKKGQRVFVPHAREDETFWSELAPDWSNVFCNAQGWREGREYSRPEAARSQLENIGAVFLPGLAFDLRGNRLGQGGGWYDCALQSLAPGVLRVGVCFDFQVVEIVPRETHDLGVSIVVTEQRTIRI